MTKNYVEPMLKILALDFKDVIMASGTDGEGDGGLYGPESPFDD